MLLSSAPYEQLEQKHIVTVMEKNAFRSSPGRIIPLHSTSTQSVDKMQLLGWQCCYKR
jgi:hypothetical protein